MTDSYDIFSEDIYTNSTQIIVYGISYDIEFFKKYKKEILDKTSPFNNINTYLLTGKELLDNDN